MSKKIAFITYETPFAPGGGIAAVMAHLPQSLQEISRIPTFVISPYHANITKTTNLESRMVTIDTIQVPFDLGLFELDIKLLDEEINWIFLKPHGDFHQVPPFFAGQRHPYDVYTKDGQLILLRDSLFFGKAVSLALPAISQTSLWTILMQDWEAVTTSLALSDQTNKRFSYSAYLTLHNSYDSGIKDRDLVKIGLDPVKHPGDTVLECALPLISDPVFTVSEQFALDLSTEVLQSEIMIPHIGSELTPRLLGVNNGAFVKNSIPDEVYIPAQEGNYSPIHNWKTTNREHAFAAIDKVSPSDSTPIWGDLQRFARGDAPWFVMAGRDDTRQKGYELACIAIEQFLLENDQARFILLPIPGDEGLPGIQFIHELACKYPEQVLGFPFLFREGFFAVLRGATFGIMPSYYEPFGMANEYYLNGVGCIGRATGGITQQIVPHRQVSSFTPAVKQRADQRHLQTSPPTGLLFRERDDIPNALEDWRKINAADYKTSSEKSNRLQQRRKIITIQSMANELKACLQDATQIYLTRQDLYYEMLINGISYITLNFSWEHTARIYHELIHNGPNLNRD